MEAAKLWFPSTTTVGTRVRTYVLKMLCHNDNFLIGKGHTSSRHVPMFFASVVKVRWLPCTVSWEYHYGTMVRVPGIAILKYVPYGTYSSTMVLEYRYGNTIPLDHWYLLVWYVHGVRTYL